MSKVVDFSNYRRNVNHELCRQCPHDETCTSVCIAIETLVQLAKVRSPMAQIEYVHNIGTQLDLENSFTAKDL
jgi:hypothetical protein